MKKKVYIALSVDFLHHGHINLINNAKKYGTVILGLLTDKAISSYKELPYLNYNQRLQIVKNLSGIDKVVSQNEWDYSKNILKIKPDFFIHGDDWNTNGENDLKRNALKALKKVSGKLIEIEHIKDISSSALKKKSTNVGGTPDVRRSSLKRLLNSGKFLKFIEVHSPISAIISENAIYKKLNKKLFYDGFWSSSLTDSINNGKPDNESLDISKRLENISRIFDVTTKPLIMDFDSGGRIEHFAINVRSAERMGISAIIIEDKKGEKQNSLTESGNKQPQESILQFCKKIKAGKNNKLTNEFMIIARIESLIMSKTLSDALKRAEAYVKAGVDGIMIHSKSKKPTEVLEFAKKFRSIKKYDKVPLICVPSSYNQINDYELDKAGFNVVIYANHLMRSSFPAMEKTAKLILKYGRTYELEKKIASIPKALNYII
jgi:phosphoenolpyruvate phosphomutase / 2-hydroxyethylphosphonate cytidylyltransferase